MEELPPGEDAPPGPSVRPEAFLSRGRSFVLLAPSGRAVDPGKLAAAGCANPRPAPLPPFPFAQARVLVEQLLLRHDTVWLETGAAGYALALPPSQLVHLTGATPADLVEDA
jgi:hypothetical protein